MNGYFAYITSNLERCSKRTEEQGYQLDETIFTLVSLCKYMDIIFVVII
ncbi:hypothetical protein [Clostridium sp.]